MHRTDPAPVLIFDLDGTILRVNSFPLWVRYLIIGRLTGMGPHRRAMLSLRALRLLLWRKFGRLSHDELQRRLQMAWQSAIVSCGPSTEDRFVATLLRYVRGNLQSLLDLAAAERLDMVLATAAAAEYADDLGRRLGFRNVLATRSGREAGEPGNSGAHKRRHVFDLLRELDWRDRKLVLFTDHIDDLPLVRECSVIFWFGPPDALARISRLSGGSRLVYCRDMTSDVLQATLRSLPAITAS